MTRRARYRRWQDDWRAKLSLERSLVVGVLLMLLWLPLPLGSNRPVPAAAFIVAIGVLLAGWAIALAWQATPRPWQGLRAGVTMAVLLGLTQSWVLAQYLGGMSADPGATLEAFALGMAYTGLFLLLLGLFNTRKRLTTLLGVLVVGGTLQAFAGALAVLTGFEWPGAPETQQAVVSGTYVNRNHLAGYLQMALAAATGLLLALRSDRVLNWRSVSGLILGPKAILRLALVIMVIGLVMTRSRMGNVAFFTSLLMMGSVFIAVTPTHRLRNALLLASFLIVDLLIVGQWFGLDALRDRITETRFSDEIAEVVDANGLREEIVVRRENVIRDEVAGYAFTQFQDRPVRGFGAGSFETSFQAYPGRDVTRRFDHAHNDFLQFGVEFGVIGTVPLGAFVLLALQQGLRPVFTQASNFRSGVGLGAAMGITAVMIHSVTDFNLQIPANAATFIVLAACAVLAGTHHRGDRTAWNQRRRSV